MVDKHSEHLGPAGMCICPKCGEKHRHRRGVPCQEERCPNCGAKMLREGSHHHRLFDAKQARQREKTPPDSGK